MNWAWWLGGGTIITILVVSALYFLGLGGVVKVVRAFFGFLGDTAENVRAWLRKPGNKTRGISAVFAFLFLAAGLQSWKRGTVIEQQRRDYVHLKESSAREAQRLKDAIASRDQTINQFTELARQQKLLLELAAKQNAVAVAEALRAQKIAAESEKKYQAEFDQRPPECKAALEVMAKACPTLKDY